MRISVYLKYRMNQYGTCPWFVPSQSFMSNKYDYDHHQIQNKYCQINSNSRQTKENCNNLIKDDEINSNK